MKPCALRFTHYALRFTHYVLRFTHHVLRFTHYVLRFTHHVLRFTSHASPLLLSLFALLLTSLACSLPMLTGSQQNTPTLIAETPALPPPTAISTATEVPSPTAAPPTPTITVSHAFLPAEKVKSGPLIYDPTSVDTATEQRAPYGDSYKINLFERPFLQDMSYIPDLDIANFNLGMDDKFYYVSIGLVGANPNNPLGILYAVELDLDADGYGDYVIVARPPHPVEWSTDNVQVWQDQDHDTAGLSAEKSDAPLPGNGYETLIFDGGRGVKDDPDLAWVRVNAGKNATVQFAFKRLLAENRFMFGVVADAGWMDIAEWDYADRLTKEQAGSPIKGDAEYPLKELFAVDNTCWQAQGFTGNYEEPKRCPKK